MEAVSTEGGAEDRAPISLVSPHARYARAVVWALAAAIVTGAAWFGVVSVFDTWIGAPAAAIGAGVGYAVLFGSGRHRGRILQAIAVAVTLAAMLVVASFGMRVVTARETEELARHGIDHLPLLLGWRIHWNLVVASFAADVTTLLFFGLSLWVAVSAPKRFTTYG